MKEYLSEGSPSQLLPGLGVTQVAGAKHPLPLTGHL